MYTHTHTMLSTAHSTHTQARAEIAALKALDGLGRNSGGNYGGGESAPGGTSGSSSSSQQEQLSGRDSMGLSVGLRIEYW